VGSSAADAESKRVIESIFGKDDDDELPPSSGLKKLRMGINLYGEHDKENHHVNPWRDVQMQWKPIHLMWTYHHIDGQEMVAVEFSTSSGMSFGNNEGIEFHAHDSVLEVTAKWPRLMYDTNVYKFYKPAQTADINIQSMLLAKSIYLKQFLGSDKWTPRSTVQFQLPFTVVETKSPWMKSITLSDDHCRSILVTLRSIVDPHFKSKQVEETEVWVGDYIPAKE
jgi:hypothetical protein